MLKPSQRLLCGCRCVFFRHLIFSRLPSHDGVKLFSRRAVVEEEWPESRAQAAAEDVNTLPAWFALAGPFSMQQSFLTTPQHAGA
jgi:hypothetical protein